MKRYWVLRCNLVSEESSMDISTYPNAVCVVEVEDWKKNVTDPMPVPFELPIGPCTPQIEVFHVPQGPCDPLSEPWVQPPQVT